MLQKFALAFKTKTIEFFAEEEEEEEEEDNASVAAADLDPAPEEVITGQRVVVLKPDPPPLSNPDALVSSLFAAVSSLRAAYLHLQTAHSPFDPNAIRTADRAIVSHLHRLSELKRAYYPDPQVPNVNANPSPNPLSLSSHLELQVQENQSLLRAFENVVNPLQSDIDRKDAEAAELRMRLREAETAGDRLQRRLEQACFPSGENLEALLTVGVFNSVLKESCRAVHRFARVLIDLMHKSGWDLKRVADSIYPNICYSKPGHCRYAILSFFCLRMFDSFDSNSFGCQSTRMGSHCGDLEFQSSDFLREFVQHSSLDPLNLMNSDPDCDFARFCHSKYEDLVNSGLKPSLFSSSDHFKAIVGNLEPSSPLYEMFVNTANSIWMLHKLAWAYDPVVELFQVGQGAEFSMVYMESVCRKSSQQMDYCHWVPRPKIGFTVVPGFRVGKTVIQCWVYLDGMKQTL
ncbi:hypothetical protein AXF42_Ash012623 [Apostasia shenzhenica]|uniref:Uncharacterized protein n=1 Tax=Apostasia shenzhenica TaxID=1088818 RepID=A0A2H9ZT64_9ASPA|nr:hypothetical protein AXF42_Ash012623 [Apostasia shenzhenica]